MSDLIKREDAIKAMEQRYEDILRTFKRKVKIGEKAIVLDMIGCVKNLPSADRPQGEWIVSDKDSVCSVCGKDEAEFICGTEDWYGYGLSKYCPNCGARMKGTRMKGADDGE